MPQQSHQPHFFAVSLAFPRDKNYGELRGFAVQTVLNAQFLGDRLP